MAYICSCGEKVKHAWSHVECTIKYIVENHKGTKLEELAMKHYPELYKKYKGGYHECWNISSKG